MGENLKKQPDQVLAPLNENPEPPKLPGEEDFFARLDGKEPDRLKTDQFARPQLVGGPRDRKQSASGLLSLVAKTIPWIVVLAVGVWVGRWSVSQYPDGKTAPTVTTEKSPTANPNARYWNPKKKK